MNAQMDEMRQQFNERGSERGRDRTHRSCENDEIVGVKTAS